MPIDNVNPSSDDNQVTLLRKLLTGFVKGSFSIGSGGGIAQNVQAADGALVSIGSKADASLLGGSASVISLLKGIANTVSSQLMSVAVLNQVVAVGNMGGFTTVNKQQPTISTSAYSSGFNVGGILTLGTAFRGNGGTAILESLTISDKSAQAAPFTILLFDAALTGTATDHSAYTVNASDVPKMVGQVVVANSDYTTTSTAAVAVKSGLGIALQNNESTKNLYAVIVTTGTPTYAALALNFAFGFLQD